MYVLFMGNDDVICIVYIINSWVDGFKYGWVGNWVDSLFCN